MTRCASLVIDVDSTLSAVEGIEWLAMRRPPDVRARITAATEAAMRGDVPLEDVYGERLDAVRPTMREITELGAAYIAAISPGARDAIGLIRDRGVQPVIVSGGIRQAILPLAAYVGIPDADTHAVSLQFDDAGRYVGFDSASPLWQTDGKPRCVAALGLPDPIAAIGDGATDAQLVGTVAMFIAFTGVACHDRVVEVANAVISTFAELPPLILR